MRGEPSTTPPASPPDGRCALCEHDGAAVVLARCPATDTPDVFAIVRCLGCGTLRTSPVPADLAPYYRTSLAATMHADRSGLFTRLRRVQLARECARLEAHGPPRTILDLGCGAGQFARLIAARGHRVIAADASSAAPPALAVPPPVPYAAFDFDAACWHAPLDATPDTVVLRHVLEHVRSPRRVIARLLGDGAQRFYVVVPDAAAVEARVLGPHWYLWDPPRHLWHFDRDSLARLCARAGLTVVARGADTAPILVPSLYRALRHRGWPRAIYERCGPNGLLAALSAPVSLLLPGNVVWVLARRS